MPVSLCGGRQLRVCMHGVGRCALHSASRCEVESPQYVRLMRRHARFRQSSPAMRCVSGDFRHFLLISLPENRCLETTFWESRSALGWSDRLSLGKGETAGLCSHQRARLGTHPAITDWDDGSLRARLLKSTHWLRLPRGQGPRLIEPSSAVSLWPGPSILDTDDAPLRRGRRGRLTAWRLVTCRNAASVESSRRRRPDYARGRSRLAGTWSHLTP